MKPSFPKNINRREFMASAGAAGAGFSMGAAAGAVSRVSILVDVADPVASTPPVRWAAAELASALAARDVAARVVPSPSQVGADDVYILAGGLAQPVCTDVLKAAGAAAPAAAEACVLASGKTRGRVVLAACGRDPRGASYALLELADRVRHAANPLDSLNVPKPVVERPANVIRSVARCFVSDVEDKPWFNDRAMWPEYLSMLATQRFNRFSLTFGIAYDFTWEIRDCYLHFAYPFLVSVPGFNVRAAGLPDSERDRNLEMLKFISEETEARGLHFQLALWTHAYDWAKSPGPNYPTEGLTPETHAAYCREALYTLLQACPAIRGVTFRVHGESGVAEGSYQFWKTVFDGIVRTGRRIEIDMHAKGMDQRMIDVALATGLPVNISPKYWAEHMGLPYHQAAIRPLELPPKRKDEGFFSLSSGSRSFLRYGYGDLLAENRRFGVLHRLWPGTQRVLLWGDPVMAAAYGRASSFCGSAGVEILEPLSFKGRKGSGNPGGRCSYRDASLQPPRWDWQKYLYTYRVWGRHLYNPDADPDCWRRSLNNEFGAAAESSGAALANASRILPLLTTAHDPSAANNNFWPEMYTNMPVVDATRRHPYGDSPSPKRFGTVSPLDPEMFSRIDDYAAELLKGERSGKYTPVEVAARLEEFAAAAAKHLADARAKAGGAGDAAFRRLAADAGILSDLGRFYAAKLRSGVLYALYDQAGSRQALEEALRMYRAARQAWVELAEKAKNVYSADVSYGYVAHLRGHWSDRLPAIDADIADMQRKLEQTSASAPGTDPERAGRAIREALSRPVRPSPAVKHTPVSRFRPGEPVGIELTLAGRGRQIAARLHYRRAHQAELYRVAEMEMAGGRYRATIPGEYTQSPYPLIYYFELRQGPETVWLYPGLGPLLATQPYFVIRQA